MRESIMLSPAANLTSLCVAHERTERLSKTLVAHVNPLVFIFACNLFTMCVRFVPVVSTGFEDKIIVRGWEPIPKNIECFGSQWQIPKNRKILCWSQKSNFQNGILSFVKSSISRSKLTQKMSNKDSFDVKTPFSSCSYNFAPWGTEREDMKFANFRREQCKDNSFRPGFSHPHKAVSC